MARNDPKAAVIQDALARWEQPLLRFAAGVVGPERARDVVQETFLRLWESGPRDAALDASGRVRAAEGLAPWLFTVCKNRAIEVARREGRMQSHSVSPPASPAPLDALVERQDGERLHAAIRALPERQQELVRLRYQSELSYKEMAELTGLTVTNVGFLLHTALHTLRSHIGGAP